MTDKKIAITGATLIDGTGGQPIPDSVVLVENDRIAQVGTSASKPIPDDTHRIDASEKYLLPGMIELHSHMYHPAMVGINFMEKEPEAYAAMYAHNMLRQALQTGITTIREVADVDHIDLSFKRAITEGVIAGPRLFVAGQGICMTGGHGWQLKDCVLEVDGPQEIIKAIRGQIKSGVDLIKILTSHRDETPEYTQEELNVGVNEAHRLGKRVAAHAASQTATDMVVKAGVDTVEHGTFLTDETVARMADQGTVWVPTCYVICMIGQFAEQALENAQQLPPQLKKELVLAKNWGDLCTTELPKSFEKVLKADIRIGTGTDAIGRDMIYAALPEELAHLTQFGCTPMQAIESATRVGAEALGVEKDLGTVEAGKYADLIMVDSDPLKDITALKTVSWVMKGGNEIPFEAAYDRMAGKVPWQ
ncbi:MAG: amidohydrolase family protein [Deltaproteobacteria bacterium]|nr:amidohydrolase family protein [Deltaproteobacteria bacterium]